MAVFCFALLEPILCAYYPTQFWITLQAIVLAISSFLYIIQIVGVATTEWDKILMIESMAQIGAIRINGMNFTLLKLFKFFTAEGEFLLEGSMILAGWILIFWKPGLASLRCFRVFRLLW
jgi:hypothetical protein